MKKNLLCLCVVVLAVMCVGCEGDTFWRLKYVPTTDAEHKAVAEEIARIMASTPHQLSGHDQDWDDAIIEAKKAACEALCQPTMWEWRDEGGANWQETGRFKRVMETNP